MTLWPLANLSLLSTSSPGLNHYATSSMSVPCVALPMTGCRPPTLWRPFRHCPITLTRQLTEFHTLCRQLTGQAPNARMAIDMCGENHHPTRPVFCAFHTHSLPLFIDHRGWRLRAASPSSKSLRRGGVMLQTIVLPITVRPGLSTFSSSSPPGFAGERSN